MYTLHILNTRSSLRRFKIQNLMHYIFISPISLVKLDPPLPPTPNLHISDPFLYSHYNNNYLHFSYHIISIPQSLSKLINPHQNHPFEIKVPFSNNTHTPKRKKMAFLHKYFTAITLILVHDKQLSITRKVGLKKTEF